MNSIVRSILIGVGTISMGFGIIGLFLPILPTPPFLLLAGACYMRSSEKHHKRLLENKWLGPYLKDYYEDKSIPLHIKIISVTCLWISLIISMIYFIQLIWVRLMLSGIGLGVTLFILSHKTKVHEMSGSYDENG